MTGRAGRAGFFVGSLVLGAALAAAAWRAPYDLSLDGPLVDNQRPGPTPRGPAHPLLLVVLDGVRVDAARRMPALQRLAAHETGSFTELEAAVPTFSAPQYVAMMTGVAPAESGIRTNRKLRDVGLQSIASRARTGGAQTAVLSDGVDWWPALFPGHFSKAQRTEEGRSLTEAIALVPSVQLAVVHWTGADSASHDFGASSEEARQAIGRLDEDLTKLVNAWGWPQKAVMVLTDHGHLSQGGHGGDETEARAAWLVTSGAGFRKAQTSRQPMTAVAATATAILAVPAPTRWAHGIEAVVDGPLAEVGAPVHEPPPSSSFGGWVGAGLIVLLAAGGALSGRRAAGLAFGGTALALVALGFGLVHGLPSFSLTRGSAQWVAHLGVLALAVSLLLHALRPRDVSGLLVLAVTLLPAAVCLAVFGAFVPRAGPESGLTAVAPLVAYVTGAASCWGAALGSVVSARRAGPS